MKENRLHNGQRFKDSKGLQWLTSPPYNKIYKDKYQAANLFLSMIMVFNGIRVSKRELEFLAYMMLRDGIVTVGKKMYSEQYGVSKNQVDNMICFLKKKKVLVKIGGKVQIHPKIVLPFKDNDNFIFQFRCEKIKEQKKD